MIAPEVLADRLDELAVRLRSQGGVTWERVTDWETATDPRLHVPEPRDEEGEARVRQGRSDVDEEDRKGDAAAARYRSELTSLAGRVYADLARIETIITVCNPDQPERLANRDLLAAQVAAEGWCPSCWRDDQHLQEIELRKSTGKPYYRGLCRWCGGWKGDTGSIPPVWIVKKHHRRTLNAADIEKATGRVS